MFRASRVQIFILSFSVEHSPNPSNSLHDILLDANERGEFVPGALDLDGVPVPQAPPRPPVSGPEMASFRGHHTNASSRNK